MFIQDLGLGEVGFVTNNEAYACQYLDQFVAQHARAQHVVMSRQNLAQAGAQPWTAHGCLEGAAGFATDLRDVMGPAYRDANGAGPPFGVSLSSQRLQYETSCAALQSRPAVLAPGAATSWTFFGVYQADHPAASSEADLAIVAKVEGVAAAWRERHVGLAEPTRTIVHQAPVAVAERLDKPAIAARYPRRTHVESRDSQALSFFTPAIAHSRHVVLRDKERLVARRHGALLRSGDEMLPTEDTLCATAWMHGVFGAQLTIGNTTLHKLFSVARDPYNIIRGNGLRILVDLGQRMAIARRSLRLRNGALRLSLALSIGRADDRRVGAGLEPGAGAAMARRRRRREMPFPGLWPSRPWRTRLCQPRPRRDRRRSQTIRRFVPIPKACGAEPIRAPHIAW